MLLLLGFGRHAKVPSSASNCAAHDFAAALGLLAEDIWPIVRMHQYLQLS